ncbi:MAG: Endonuclease III [uncultured bacterium]|nr:MAG: Endonuclease III [uncultured bacterium]HBH17784.1 endonuclease III [Cyanobacteria bacterium UBA9579]
MPLNTDKIFDLLEKEKDKKSPFVSYMDKNKDPFKTLIACLLSLRTKDETTYGATLRLFNLGSTPDDFLKLNEEEIQKAIYPVGFYRNKTGVILGICRDLLDKYNGIVPDEIDELLKLKGVGRKTANLVVSKGYGKPAICVDTHVHRISNRLGFVKTKNPDETEMALREKLPKKYWNKINDLMVTHGQNTCKPVNPKCNICTIEPYCQKIIK